MLFRSKELQAIMDGRVTTVYRRWKRPTARGGTNVRTQMGMVTIHSVDVVDPDTLTHADAVAANHASLDELQRMFHAGEGTCYRITLGPGGVDPREALRLALPSTEELATLTRKLARLDGDAPWTFATLRLIAGRPGVVSTELATAMGQERMVFKDNVRKLKALGLTISLEVGYRLSSRGEFVLAHSDGR